jgi:hypothetical protein
LFGLAAHRWYNYGLVIESLLMLAGWMFLVPSRPLYFAAAWWGVSLFLNRGLRPSWLVSRSLGISFRSLLAGIYVQPLLASAATATLAGVLFIAIPHSNWYQLGGLAVVLGVFHLTSCFFFVLAPEHRRMLLNFRTLSKAPA